MLTSYTWWGAVLRAGLLLALLGLVAGAALAINPIRARRLGGAPAFNPANYGAGTLRAWFKADSLSLADGASVTTWRDSSGNGNDASGGTSPVYKTGIQNGKPGVLFTRASSQYLLANGLASVQNGTDLPYTVVHVIRPVSLSTGVTHIFSSWGSTGSVNPLVWNYSNSEQLTALRRDDGATQLSTTTGTLYTTSAQILTYRYTGTQVSIFQNGATAKADTSLDVGALTVDSFALGARAGTVSNYYDGYLFEVLVYASALSDADRKAIERSRGMKWGIAVS